MTDDIAWDDDLQPLKCPICGTIDTVYGSGNPFSNGLIIGEFPGNDEVKIGRPMVGRMGTILNIELHKVGLDIKNFRLCNLWHHPKNKDADCLKFGSECMMRETNGKKAVLLLGSDVSKFFLYQGIMEVAGMKVEPTLLKGKIVVASVNPAYVFESRNGVGEIRLAMSRFAKYAGGVL